MLNRRQLVDRMKVLRAEQGAETHAALLLIDLDRFHLVNNSLGHEAGDEVLRDSARRISAVARAGDSVARLGGDEFLILCLDTDEHEALSVANRILRGFDQDLSIGGQDLHVAVSIGVTAVSREKKPREAMREADYAKQYAKAQGGNTAVLFKKSHSNRASHLLELEQSLRKALERQEFLLHFQPIHRIEDGSLTGVEALVRWNRPDVGMIPPDEFIPAAENTRLISPLGDWILDEALRQLSEWKRSNDVPPDFTVSVNLSPVQLSDENLVARITQLLTKHDIAAASLTLEMTETALIEEHSQRQTTVTDLASAGISLSIDDFGTGYSSLAYLRYLPSKELKVDRTFVAGLTTDTHDRALVSAVISIAHEFGMVCVAEGVETAEQLEQLEILGCDLAQGYHLGRPATAAALTQTWRERRSMPTSSV